MSRYDVVVDFSVADIMKPLPEAAQEIVNEKFFRAVEEDVIQQVRALAMAAEAAGTGSK